MAPLTCGCRTKYQRVNISQKPIERFKNEFMNGWGNIELISDRPLEIILKESNHIVTCLRSFGTDVGTWWGALLRTCKATNYYRHNIESINGRSR
ncbi:unnamed protein product [Lupinus luteus]|uniref:Uncharacterized protein n=1 Tax=Lupinus luteus TaxID=3873 RepID=A0AAV1W6S0_LUPLU